MTKYILYHRSCLDGYLSACIALKVMPDAIAIPVAYQQPVPDLKGGSEVYILDFSYPKEILKDLMTSHAQVVVLDHHKTALNELSGFSNAIFDLTKCGARLTWEYFYSNEPVPLIVKHIEDRDLWKFDLPETKALTMALWHHCTLDNPKSWLPLLTEIPTELYSLGQILLEVQASQIEKQLAYVYLATLPDSSTFIPMLNSALEVSETGHAMNEAYPETPYSCCWTQTGDKIKASLRTNKSEVDVGLIAKAYGGGGHPKAAGFVMSVKDWQGCQVTTPPVKVDISSLSDKDLRNLILTKYDTYTDLALAMTQAELDFTLTGCASPYTPMTEVVFNLIRWAKSRGKLSELNKIL
jgi:hypothetical protein